ncbi:MAG: hypothetical protein ACLF0G_07185 [Candidatus Brocadiia bacterium]
MRRLATLALTALVAGSAAQALAGQASVEVVALSLAKKDPDSKFGQSFALGQRAGTSVNVRIVHEGKTFVKVMDRASKLAAFADDKGTDLTTAEKPRFGMNRWLARSQVADDGKSCVVEIRSDAVPASGATALALKATIAIRCGSDVQTAEQKDVALEKGTAITTGPIPMKITKASKPQWGDAELSITLQSDKSFDAIKSLAFVDAQGNEIKCRKTGSTRMGFGDQFTYTREYSLEKKIDKATLRVEYYGKTEVLNVPVEATVGVGL